MFRFQQLARVAILASFIVGHIGFPVLDVHEAIDGAAFPCQGHQCGCQTADHCWHSCCCMPLGERLAWAKRNHIAPPRDIVELAAATNEVDDVPTCCTKRKLKAEHHSTESKNRTSLRWVTSLQAMKCRGHASYWSAAAEPALATSALLSCRFDFPPIGTMPVVDEFSESWESTPPVPPG